MNPYTVIIDNDSLCHLAFIDTQFPVIDRLRSIFSAIHIPDEILAEFETHHHKNPERQKIILQAYTPGRFFRKCSSFDTISKAFLQTEKGIDSGEAAAAAQYQKIQSRYIISEDTAFRKKISQIYPGIRLLKLKHVLAILDLHGYIDDWKGCIKVLHNRRPITSKELREAYSNAAEIYGITIRKNTLSEKSSFKKLGITNKRI
jgi:hypothetical protein